MPGCCTSLEIPSLRKAAIREIFGRTGKNCVVEQPLFCTYGYNTTVGDNFFLNVDCKLMDSGKITIGDNVWICTGAIILPGVTIGSNSVVGAGSVVTKDIPPRSLAVGNPCRVIRTL